MPPPLYSEETLMITGCHCYTSAVSWVTSLRWPLLVNLGQYHPCRGMFNRFFQAREWKCFGVTMCLSSKNVSEQPFPKKYAHLLYTFPTQHALLRSSLCFSGVATFDGHCGTLSVIRVRGAEVFNKVVSYWHLEGGWYIWADSLSVTVIDLKWIWIFSNQIHWISTLPPKY